MSDKINRFGILILSVLEKEEAHSQYTGLTIKDIKEELQEISEQENTFYKIIKKLCENNYVGSGVKDGKSFTYYITKTGSQMLEKVKGVTKYEICRQSSCEKNIYYPIAWSDIGEYANEIAAAIEIVSGEKTIVRKAGE